MTGFFVCRRGVAALEFALVAPILLALLLSVYDIGGVIEQRLVLEQALRAGGQYALSFPDRTDGILAMIKQSYPSGWTGVDPTVSTLANGTPPYYITLGVNSTFSTILLPISNTRLTYVVRVQ
jgi:Flp pilus assembly protein TadG